VKIAMIVVAMMLLGGCPKPAPLVPFPDASDAAVMGDVADAGQFVPQVPPAPCSTVCTDACTAIQTAGCVQRVACCSTLTRIDSEHLIKNLKTGAPLTCAELAKVKTADDVRATGQICGPVP